VGVAPRIITHVSGGAHYTGIDGAVRCRLRLSLQYLAFGEESSCLLVKSCLIQRAYDFVANDPMAIDKK
jgi:hypothetical protein